MGIYFQVIAAILLSFSCMNMGILLAWPSSTILVFKSENTTLHRPMSDTEVALFSSLPAVGSMVANPVAAVLLDKIGRKRTVMLTSLTYVTAWSIIGLSNRVEAILSTMIVAGFGCAMFMEVTIYISEISQDSIRGTLTAVPNQLNCLGFLVSYFLGGALGYYEMVYTCLSLAVLGVLMIAVLKESPLTLMEQGREEDAMKSIAFYRRTNITSADVVTTINNLRRILNSKSEDAQSLTTVEEKLEPELRPKKMSCWEFFKSTPSTRRQFYLVLVLKLALICQGLPILQIYAEPMFSEAVGDVISPNLCSVLLGLVVLLAGLIAAALVDVAGRRPLAIYSSVGAGVCCAVLGAQIMTECFPKWSIPMFIYAFAMFHTFGAGTVPFVILGEVFLPEVKSVLSMLAVEWTWLCQFVCVFVFGVVVRAAGLAPVFIFFALTCFLTATYFYYRLPETKGLPVYAIQELFEKRIKKHKSPSTVKK